MAWLTLTMAAISVFIQALQRHNHDPWVVDCKRLNLVLRWVRRHPVGIWFPRLAKPLRIVGVSDSAFRAQPEQSSGLALRGCAIILTTESARSLASPDGNCSMLEYVCRRHRRVVRSTYSGELNGLIDTSELLLVIQMCLHQIWHGTEDSAMQMAHKMETGRLEPPAEVVTATAPATTVGDGSLGWVQHVKSPFPQSVVIL